MSWAIRTLSKFSSSVRIACNRSVTSKGTLVGLMRMGEPTGLSLTPATLSQLTRQAGNLWSGARKGWWIWGDDAPSTEFSTPLSSFYILSWDICVVSVSQPSTASHLHARPAAWSRSQAKHRSDSRLHRWFDSSPFPNCPPMYCCTNSIPY